MVHCYYLIYQEIFSVPDIDECYLVHGLCDQQCTNTIGSYTCSCADGYILSEEHNRCKAEGSVEITCMSYHVHVQWITQAGYVFGLPF